jgi:hypothetical protein
MPAPTLPPAQRAIAALVLVLALAGCAEPQALKAPAHAPTFQRPADANPLPAYATPDPGDKGPAKGQGSDGADRP